MIFRRLLALSFMLGCAAVLSACSVVFDPNMVSSSVPENTGRRFDMVLQDPARGYRGSTLDPWIREVWLNSSSLSGWFLIVDRVSAPDDTVVLNTSFGGVKRSSRRVGSPKYGYSTIYYATAEVVFTLVDMRSGRVLATAMGRGSGTGDNRNDLATHAAINSGLHRLISNYAGGGA